MLSTTEAEHIDLFTALKEAIPMIQLLRKLHAVMGVQGCDKNMMYNVFENDNGSIELVKTLKTRPRTKHMSIKHHQFRSFVVKVVIRTLKVDTVEQEAEFLTKPLSAVLFSYLRSKVLGW